MPPATTMAAMSRSAAATICTADRMSHLHRPSGAFLYRERPDDDDRCGHDDPLLFGFGSMSYFAAPARRIRSASMNRGNETSWTTTENPITAGTDRSYRRPVVVLPTNQP